MEDAAWETEGAGSHCLGRKVGESTVVGGQGQRVVQEKESASSLYTQKHMHILHVCTHAYFYIEHVHFYINIRAFSFIMSTSSYP